MRDRIIQSIKRAGQGIAERFAIVAKMGEEFQTLDFLISAVRDDQGNVTESLRHVNRSPNVLDEKEAPNTDLR
jgi:hypothetical protein